MSPSGVRVTVTEDPVQRKRAHVSTTPRARTASAARTCSMIGPGLSQPSRIPSSAKVSYFPSYQRSLESLKLKQNTQLEHYPSFTRPSPTECNCNGLASRCVFDEEVFIQSNNASGGVCIGCRANTAGKT